VPGEHQRKQVGGPGEHSDRVVIGDLAQLTTSNLEHTGSRRRRAGPARPLETSIKVSVVPAPGDSDSQRPGKCGILVLLPDQAAPPGLDNTVISARRFRISGRHGSLEPPPPLVSLTRAWLPATRQIRKMCEIPAYLRVVSEKHPRQASATDASGQRRRGDRP